MYKFESEPCIIQFVEMAQFWQIFTAASMIITEQMNSKDTLQCLAILRIKGK